MKGLYHPRRLQIKKVEETQLLGNQQGMTDASSPAQRALLLLAMYVKMRKSIQHHKGATMIICSNHSSMDPIETSL
jgi:hypothetical protein